jgi:hypothetical protein
MVSSVQLFAQVLIDALTDLRQGGHVPWDWIVDETRALESYVGAPIARQLSRPDGPADGFLLGAAGASAYILRRRTDLYVPPHVPQ